MATIELYGGSTSSINKVSDYYAAHLTSSTASYQKYRSLYKINLNTLTSIVSFSFTTLVRVSKGGNAEKVKIKAYLYNNQADAQALNNNYIQTVESEKITVYATATKNVLTFQFTNLNMSSDCLYISFAVTYRSPASNLIEIVHNDTYTKIVLNNSCHLQIYKNTTDKWTSYVTYIYKNNTDKWKPYIPYIYNGT